MSDRRQQRYRISIALATAVTSKAVPVDHLQCNTWLFGGCGLDPAVSRYMDAVALVHGHVVDEAVDFDPVTFKLFMDKVVGGELAELATQLILSEDE